MAKYKLLKDLPFDKAGTIVEIMDVGESSVVIFSESNHRYNIPFDGQEGWIREVRKPREFEIRLDKIGNVIYPDKYRGVSFWAGETAEFIKVREIL